MNFEQIEYFLSCAACLNFSRAAAYHYVSVSTLSRSISALEAELGTELFRRGYHGHDLTEAGERFFDCALKMEEALDSFHAQQGRERYFTVACYPRDGSFTMLINGAAAPTDSSGRKWKVRFARPGELAELLLSGKADIGIGSAEDLRPGLELRPFPFEAGTGLALIFSTQRGCAELEGFLRAK